MDREDSGLIDLFAIHARASEAPPAAPSAPPPAVALDIGGMDEGDVPFVDPQRKKKVMMGLGAAGGLLVIGIIIASVTGGSTPEPTKAAAAAAKEAPAAPAPEPPPPAVTAAPQPAPPPPPTATAEAPKPAGKAAPAKFVGKAPAAPARGVGGVKLQKVQSAGIAGESKPAR